MTTTIKTKKVPASVIRQIRAEIERSGVDPNRVYTTPEIARRLNIPPARAKRVVLDYGVPYLPKASGAKITEEFIYQDFIIAHKKYIEANRIRR